MLPIRKNCCCVEKKTGLRENLREIMDADSVGGLGGQGRERARCYLPEK